MCLNPSTSPDVSIWKLYLVALHSVLSSLMFSYSTSFLLDSAICPQLLTLSPRSTNLISTKPKGPLSNINQIISELYHAFSCLKTSSMFSLQLELNPNSLSWSVRPCSMWLLLTIVISTWASNLLFMKLNHTTIQFGEDGGSSPQIGAFAHTVSAAPPPHPPTMSGTVSAFRPSLKYQV